MQSVYFAIANPNIFVHVLEIVQELDIEATKDNEMPVLKLDYRSNDWIDLVIYLRDIAYFVTIVPTFHHVLVSVQ